MNFLAHLYPRASMIILTAAVLFCSTPVQGYNTRPTTPPRQRNTTSHSAPSESALTPEQRRALNSIRNRLQNMRQRRENLYRKVAYNLVKITLHELCRNCGTCNCDDQGITGACRHWARTDFDGRGVRVCHQLPAGSQRYSGIDQAISSLLNQNQVIMNTIQRVTEKIYELRAEYCDIAGSEDALPPETPCEYEDYQPNIRYYSSPSRNSSRNSSRRRYRY